MAYGGTNADRTVGGAVCWQSAAIMTICWSAKTAAAFRCVMFAPIYVALPSIVLISVIIFKSVDNNSDMMVCKILQRQNERH